MKEKLFFLSLQNLYLPCIVTLELTFIPIDNSATFFKK